VILNPVPCSALGIAQPVFCPEARVGQTIFLLNAIATLVTMSKNHHFSISKTLFTCQTKFCFIKFGGGQLFF
jgi:hypothetical protein